MTPQALLVMDFQNGILDRYPVEDTVRSAVRAVFAARDADVPVIFVRVAFRPGYPEIAATNTTFAATRSAGDAMTESNRATQIHDAFDVRPDEPIVTKRRISAFAGSDLDVVLRSAGVSSVVVAGVATSGVVLSTIRQAADLDFGIHVLSDACADADPEVHRVLLEKVFPRQATVTDTSEWIEGLTGRQ